MTREDFNGMRPIAEIDPGGIEAMTEFRRQVGRSKAASPKAHIGLRLAAEAVESNQGDRPRYNARVEQAWRETFLTSAARRAAKAGRMPEPAGPVAARQAARGAAGKRKARSSAPKS